LQQGDIIIFSSQIIGAFIQPLVVYVASGYFYYRASKELEIK
jgi:hypothetical protein